MTATATRHTTGPLRVESRGGSGYRVVTNRPDPMYVPQAGIVWSVDVLRHPSIPDSEREANARLFAAAAWLLAACEAAVTDPDILAMPGLPAWRGEMLAAIAAAKGGVA